MELNFTELDDLNNNKNYYNDNNYNTSSSGVENTNSYWEKPNETNPKKKRVTYDDILTSLNLLVNPNGVLQFMTVKSNNDLFFQKQGEPQYSQQPPKLNSKPLQNSKPLEPQVKNSYIFNKYFKDYKDTNNIPLDEPKRPQTIEEHNKMVFEERIRRINERNRIAQIKSTKILFENNSTINVSRNNLHRMSFK